MLALLGAGAIGVLLVAILSNRASPLVALIVVPVAAALLGGFGLQTAKFVVDGVTQIAPTAALFVFAILFFGVMTDAGLLDPIIARVLRIVGEKPTRIVVGSALLALLVHLDGSGAVCFLVVIPTMLPLYERLGLDKRVLACVVSMAAGVNFLPWTGPMVRSASALQVPVLDIFRPMIPVQVVGLAFVFGAAWWLGRREERRLRAAVTMPTAASVAAVPSATTASSAVTVPSATVAPTALAAAAVMPAPAAVSQRAPDTVDFSLRRPKLFWVNLLLTLVVMSALVAGIGAPAGVFMVGAALALLINYREAAQQRARVEAHAKAALTMAAILLAAGAFTGILGGMGALGALARAAVAWVPPGAGAHIPFALSLVAMPLSMVFDPDSFYFGVMPVIAEMHRSLGGAPVEVAQAALVGQMTAGFPVSPLTPATFLVAGLTGIDLAAHQRFTFLWLYAASLVMALACLVFGVFPP